MLRKLLLAAALALPVAVTAGHGSSLGVVHAQGTGPGAGSTYAGFYCDTSYPLVEPPFFSYTMFGCEIGGGGPGPDTNGNYIEGLYQNEVDTLSLQGEGCQAASIVNGDEYYNPTGFVEFAGFNQANGTITGHARCTVQTGDTGLTHNLYATLEESFCDVGVFGIVLPGSYSLEPIIPEYVNLYESESPTGVVTAYCDVSYSLI